MKLALAVLALASVLGVCHAQDDPTTSLSGVADLTSEDFDSIVNGRKHALVEFYAPWCGHCKRMTPEFKTLGEKVTSDGKLSSRVVIAKVDADKHRELGSRFDVKGFPTILYFARGKPVESHTPYQGARTYDGFLSFIEEQLENDKGFARSPALDALATKFLGAAEDARSAVVEEVKTAAAALTGDAKASGDLYERYIQKAITKGADYFQNEYDRLDRIIASGSASPAKLAEAARKSSVLSAFIPSMNTAEDAADAADDLAEDAAAEDAGEDAAEGEEVGDAEEFEDAEEGEEVSEEELAEADLLEAEGAME